MRTLIGTVDVTLAGAGGAVRLLYYYLEDAIGRRIVDELGGQLYYAPADIDDAKAYLSRLTTKLVVSKLPGRTYTKGGGNA